VWPTCLAAVASPGALPRRRGVVVTGNTVSGMQTPGAKSNRLTDIAPWTTGTDARDGGLLATAGPPRRTAGSPDVFPSRPHAVVNR
jgi:hypothetical protein